MLGGGQTPTARGSALGTRTTGHRQVPGVTEVPGLACKAKPSRPMMLQARTCPAAVLRSQLRHRSETQRVSTLSLLGELARSDTPVARQKLTQGVLAMQLVCTDPSVQVRRAVLEFIRELLSSGSQSCWPWDVVGHIFSEYSRSSGRLAAGGLFAWEPQEDRALRAPHVDILGSLDVSRRGMSQLLWPRLLQYVVPAQCSGVLIPLSRCLRALLERRERAGCEEEEEPDAVDSQEQGRAESSLDSAEWEQHVLKLFLYEALGTALAGGRDLSHVQGQVLMFLQDTDSVELSETQGMISVVSHAAETHFNLVLDTVTALTRDRFYETSMGWKVKDPGFRSLTFLFLTLFSLLHLL
ncbi:uncharacterized protein [Patagioenas fasciata]|uniref:uncharacterized protein isoform X2 n=1 Tax=Patagioenas fasciata TaxID=372321 RepID=UPI003A99CC0D